MKVDEIMTRKLESIGADASIYDAIERMIDKRIRSLLVNPKDARDTYGVITVRDIVYNVLWKNLDLTRTKVGDITSKPLICVDKGMDVKNAIDSMSKFKVSRVFVCEEKQVVGIISLLDVMSAELVKRAREGRGV